MHIDADCTGRRLGHGELRDPTSAGVGGGAIEDEGSHLWLPDGQAKTSLAIVAAVSAEFDRERAFTWRLRSSMYLSDHPRDRVASTTAALSSARIAGLGLGALTLPVVLRERER
jgi:hypothetical protein